MSMALFSNSGTASNFLISNSTSTSTTSIDWFYASASNVVVIPAAPTPPRPPRTFNRFLNASDLLEEFIKDLGPLAVRQSDVLQIPIELFINWLVVRSAEHDNAEVPDVPMLPARLNRKDRCLDCGRFLPRKLISAGLNFCNPEHFARKQLKVAA